MANKMWEINKSKWYWTNDKERIVIYYRIARETQNTLIIRDQKKIIKEENIWRWIGYS
jgi:hypothetical protein